MLDTGLQTHFSFMSLEHSVRGCLNLCMQIAQQSEVGVENLYRDLGFLKAYFCRYMSKQAQIFKGLLSNVESILLLTPEYYENNPPFLSTLRLEIFQ